MNRIIQLIILQVFAVIVFAETSGKALLVLTNGRIRKEASKTGETAKGVAKDDTLLFTELKDGWYAIVDKDNNPVGFIASSVVKEFDISVQAPIAAPEPSSATAAGEITLISNGKIRASASKDGSVVRGAAKGEKLPYSGEKDGWYRVMNTDGGELGYVIKTNAEVVAGLPAVRDTVVKVDSVKADTVKKDTLVKVDSVVIKDTLVKVDSVVKSDTAVKAEMPVKKDTVVVPGFSACPECSVEVRREVSRDTFVVKAGRLAVSKAGKLRKAPTVKVAVALVKKADTLSFADEQRGFYGVLSDTGVVGWLIKASARVLSSPETSLVTLYDTLRADSLLRMCEKRKADSLAVLDSIRRAEDSLALVAFKADSTRKADSVSAYLAKKAEEESLKYKVRMFVKQHKKPVIIGASVLTGGLVAAIALSGGEDAAGPAASPDPQEPGNPDAGEIPVPTMPPPD